MKLEIHLDPYETYTNIGMTKAMIESTLTVKDLKEIAEYLIVYSNNHPTEKGDVQE